jgi:hypothetical protein
MSFGFQNDNFVVMSLHSAASKGNATSLQELLSLSSANMNATNKVPVQTPVNYFCGSLTYAAVNSLYF